MPVPLIWVAGALGAALFGCENVGLEGRGPKKIPERDSEADRGIGDAALADAAVLDAARDAIADVLSPDAAPDTAGPDADPCADPKACRDAFVAHDDAASRPDAALDAVVEGHDATPDAGTPDAVPDAAPPLGDGATPDAAPVGDGGVEQLTITVHQDGEELIAGDRLRNENLSVGVEGICGNDFSFIAQTNPDVQLRLFKNDVNRFGDPECFTAFFPESQVEDNYCPVSNPDAEGVVVSGEGTDTIEVNLNSVSQSYIQLFAIQADRMAESARLFVVVGRECE